MSSSVPEPELRGFPSLRRCRVMGIVNVTPDSFSDGGRFYDTDKAIARGLTLAAEGADLVDVGGESTRPGAQRVDVAEEQRRVLPVVRALAAEGVAVSIDTMRAEVAAAAVDAGAALVNDVSGGQADPRLPAFVAEAGVPYILMHWRGHSADMQKRAEYADVIMDVRHELLAQFEAVLARGVAAEQVVLDPGIGFAKLPHHDWELLARLDVFTALGRPVLVGASKKKFLGRLLESPDGTPREPDGRRTATAAVTALAAAAGVWGVRVHDGEANLDAVRVATRWRESAASRPACPGGDRIALRGLRVFGRHGVFEHERREGQAFVVDVVLDVDTAPAARADDLGRTVDYGGLADRLAAVVAGEPVNLIETVAERLADVCLSTAGVRAVEVTVHKPQAPVRHEFGDVAVTIVRTAGAGEVTHIHD